MNTVIILMSGLLHHVTGQNNDIFPARILAQQKTISENSDLYLTCSTFGKKNIPVHVHLCKDDVGILVKTQKADTNDTTFIIRRVSLNYTGSYSCVYSVRNDSTSRVSIKGHVIQIQVIANFLPADISVAGPSTVSEGQDIEFRCTLSVALQTLGECQLIQSYLQRNDSILQVQTFNVKKMEATFSIEEAVKRDSGYYSCVVLPSKCIEHEEMISGNNTVVLQVAGQEEGHLFRLAVYCALISLMLVMALCLCWIKGQVRRVRSQIQEKAEGQDLETQGDKSFNSEDEQLYQNSGVDEHSDGSSYDDIEGLYSLADDGPDASQVCVYAHSSKKGTPAMPI